MTAARVVLARLGRLGRIEDVLSVAGKSGS